MPNSTKTSEYAEELQDLAHRLNVGATEARKAGNTVDLSINDDGLSVSVTPRERYYSRGELLDAMEAATKWLRVEPDYADVIRPPIFDDLIEWYGNVQRGKAEAA